MQIWGEVSFQSVLFAMEERVLVATWLHSEGLVSKRGVGLAVGTIRPDRLSKQFFVTSCVEEVVG